MAQAAAATIGTPRNRVFAAILNEPPPPPILLLPAIFFSPITALVVLRSEEPRRVIERVTISIQLALQIGLLVPSLVRAGELLPSADSRSDRA